MRESLVSTSTPLTTSSAQFAVSLPCQKFYLSLATARSLRLVYLFIPICHASVAYDDPDSPVNAIKCSRIQKWYGAWRF